MNKNQDWNQRVQKVLEMAFYREAKLMEQWPGGAEAAAHYRQRLYANKKILKTREAHGG